MIDSSFVSEAVDNAVAIVLRRLIARSQDDEATADAINLLGQDELAVVIISAIHEEVGKRMRGAARSCRKSDREVDEGIFQREILGSLIPDKDGDHRFAVLDGGKDEEE